MAAFFLGELGVNREVRNHLVKLLDQIEKTTREINQIAPEFSIYLYGSVARWSKGIERAGRKILDPKIADGDLMVISPSTDFRDENFDFKAIEIKRACLPRIQIEVLNMFDTEFHNAYKDANEHGELILLNPGNRPKFPWREK